jgi:hypothetical protein
MGGASLFGVPVCVHYLQRAIGAKAQRIGAHEGCFGGAAMVVDFSVPGAPVQAASHTSPPT